MKKYTPAAFLLAMLFLLSVTAEASQTRQIHAGISLSFSGTVAQCTATCFGDAPTDGVSATLTLWQGNTRIASWDASANAMVSISKTAPVKLGGQYQLVLTWTVNGTAQPMKVLTKVCNG